MNKIFHPANERGHFDHGWLKTYHSFSFASWYSPQKINFGKLRVLNDDVVQAGEGFGMHPHDNMEIVTIPLKGSLAHKDSMGNEEIINENEVQVMSAGTGIYHSEFNPSKTENVSLLQIWIFPDKKGYSPRYAQKYFNPLERKNKFQLLVSPDKNSETLWLNQNTYFTLIDLDENLQKDYLSYDKENGVYVFLIDGKIKICDTILSSRDAFGIWENENVEISSIEDSKILIIEVPMM